MSALAYVKYKEIVKASVFYATLKMFVCNATLNI